jgi:hypothetical protein
MAKTESNGSGGARRGGSEDGVAGPLLVVGGAGVGIAGTTAGEAEVGVGADAESGGGEVVEVGGVKGCE